MFRKIGKWLLSLLGPPVEPLGNIPIGCLLLFTPLFWLYLALMRLAGWMKKTWATRKE